MNEIHPILKLVILVQMFLLFGLLLLPLLVRMLQDPAGRIVYGLFAILCIAQALLLRRAFNKLQ